MGYRNKNNNDRNVKKSDNQSNNKEKKPFNKKKYREQKYSNKYKVAQWEEKRKKAVLREFHKDLKKDEALKLKFPTKDNIEQSNGTSDTTKRTKGAFFNAKQEFLRKQKEKEKRKQEYLKAKEEREEALKKYKEKKIRAFKALSRKTKKGQPVMKGRMELLLEKIMHSS